MSRWQHFTLFLDRDGVINRKLENDYVKTPEEFEFLPGVLEALKGFKKFFKKNNNCHQSTRNWQRINDSGRT